MKKARGQAKRIRKTKEEERKDLQEKWEEYRGQKKRRIIDDNNNNRN